MSLSVPAKNRIMIDTFLGINRRERISSGELADCVNVTADKYPCLATRAPRGIVRFRDEDKNIVSPMCPGKPVAALTDGDDIVFVSENSTFIKGDKVYEFFNGRAKQLVAFNDRYVVAPFVASVASDLSEVKTALAVVSGKMTISLLAEPEGSGIEYVSAEEAPTDGTKYWFSTKENGLYCWSEDESKYIAWPTTYIKFANSSLDFSDFAVGDTVSLMSGETQADAAITSYTVKKAGLNYIVVTGICNPAECDEETVYTLCREAPQLDYIVAHKNRIWGCHYGLVTTSDGDKFINEIYASKLGDATNWYSYQGISTDSYTVSVGEGGAFTGCGIVGDNVVFFKENCMYTIYGSLPSSYQVSKTDCFGIQDGSFRSAVTINGVLYYKSNHGIMRLESGSLPVCISSALGTDIWSEAIAGTDGEKYYIQMKTPSGEYQLFVYDTATGFWYRESTESNKEILCFVNYKNNLIYVTGNQTDIECSKKCGFYYDLHPEAKPQPPESFTGKILYLLALVFYGITVLRARTLYNLFSFMPEKDARKAIAEKLGKDNITDEEFNEFIQAFMEPVGYVYYWSCDFVYASGELGCNTELPCSLMEYNADTDEYEKISLVPELRTERGFQWLAETGDFGMNYSDFKHVSAIQIRMKLEEGSSVSVDISYDGESYRHLKCFDKPMKSTGRIDIRPFVKCDNFRLRFKGKGQCVIYSITITYEDGGDKNVGF
ncbi:MAG: hypothetical protein IKJ88_00925 [Clostridia bacterium]|nr:hypothetical protein [Clostridia bacterium]